MLGYFPTRILEYRLVFDNHYIVTGIGHFSQSPLDKLAPPPKHSPFHHIGYPMSLPGFFPPILLPLDTLPPFGCQSVAFPHPSHSSQEAGRDSPS